MGKIYLSGIHPNPSFWVKLLLTIGLLLVFVQGLSQLYDVQNFFFPGRYYEIELNLVKGEYVKINKSLQSLTADIDKLKVLRENRDHLQTQPPDRKLSNPPSSPDSDRVRVIQELSWQSTLQDAKKARVYVARKLPLIDAQLKCLHRALERQLSENGSASLTNKPETKKLLQRVQEDQACWRTYCNQLDDLTEQLKRLAKWGQV
jgi:hypothetical protein